MSKFKKYINELKKMEIMKLLKSMSSKVVKSTDFANPFFPETTDDLKKDYLLLSKSRTCDVVNQLLKNDLTVICNLNDRDGKIGLEIKEVDNNIEFEYSTLYLKGGSKHSMYDRFLYNVKYINKKDHFSLEEHDEYFEKLTVKNNED